MCKEEQRASSTGSEKKTITDENFVDQPVIITKKHKDFFIFSLFKKNSYPFFPIFNICCVDLIDSLTELCPMCLTGPLGTTPQNFIYDHHHHSHQCPQIHKYKYKYRTPGNDQNSTTITVSRTSVLKCTKTNTQNIDTGPQVLPNILSLTITVIKTFTRISFSLTFDKLCFLFLVKWFLPNEGKSKTCKCLRNLK